MERDSFVDAVASIDLSGIAQKQRAVRMKSDMLPAKERPRVVTFIQIQTLRAIADLTEELGQPPLLVELADTLGITANSVPFRLEALEKHGLIERRAGESRSLKVTAKGRELLANEIKGGGN